MSSTSAGRRYGLSAADSCAARVKTRCSSLRGGALDRLGHGGGRLGGSAAAPSSSGPAAASPSVVLRCAIALASCVGRLAQLLDLAQELLAVRADGLELVEQRLVGGEPLVGGLAARPGGLLGLLAALGQVRLGRRGARLGALELRREALGARAELGALGVGGLAAALGRLDLAAQVLDAGEVALGLLLAGGHRVRSSSASRSRASSGDDGISACWRNFSHEPKTSTT